ncbi:MAG: thioredoxin family protein [Chitinophagales bacterium]
MKKKTANLLIVSFCFSFFFMQNSAIAQSSLLKDARSARGQFEKADAEDDKKRKKLKKSSKKMKEGVIFLEKEDELGASEGAIDVREMVLDDALVKDRLSYFHKGSWKSLENKAKIEKKPIILDFYADWCRPCKQMDRESLANEEVAAYIKENYIAYKVDTEKEKEIAENFKVENLPAFVFLDHNGQEIGRVSSYLTKEAFFKTLKKNKPKVPNTNFSDFR